MQVLLQVHPLVFVQSRSFLWDSGWIMLSKLEKRAAGGGVERKNEDYLRYKEPSHSPVDMAVNSN